MRKKLLGAGPKDQLWRTALLGYTCTVIDCRALLTRIEIEEETVTVT
ncbi:hypothetical protein [uncultured Serinicoccus sp.]|nr:hypothetical protein [uncultured Serinicoccus sp.]